MLAPDDLISAMWTLPPGAPGGKTTLQQDFDNLRASKVKRLEIVAPFCTAELMRVVRNETQVRHFSTRLHDYDYDNPAARSRWHVTLATLLAEGLDTVVLGAEVDSAFDATFASKDWGTWRAVQIRDSMYDLLDEWQDLVGRGLRIVSPAIMYRGHYRDGREGLQPGMYRWREIMRPAANEFWANAVHVYGADPTWYDTQERVRVGLWDALSNANKPAWLGEVNIDRGSDVEQMTWLCRLLTLLYWTDPRHPDYGKWVNFGDRLVQVAPFAANGNTEGWGSPNHLITDLEAYKVLGRFMGGERFPFPH